MGEELTRNTSRLAEPPKRSTDPGTGTGAGKQADRNSSTATAGAGKPAGAGGSTGTGTGKAEEKKVSGLASVTEAPPLPEQPKKKQRKPRQKKQEPTNFNADQITALIVAVSGIVASREGMQMFALSEMEAKQISTPLANMIEKSETLKGISEHADAVSLVTACIVIFAPRIMMYMEANKTKKKGAPRLVRTENPESKKSDGDSRKPVESPSRQQPTNANGFFADLPALM